MSRRPYSNRGGRGHGRTTPINGSVRLDGLFEKGVWKCNCTPRLPAEHFRVKKEGRNNGRWFYTCQRTQAERCGFFLWDDDAAPRMEAAVLNNSISELPRAAQSHAGPAQEVERDSLAQRRAVSPPPPYTPFTNPSKRKLPWQESDFDQHDDGAEVFPWRLTGEEEQVLSQAVEQAQERRHEHRASLQPPPPPVTPRKSLKTGADTSPSRPTATGLPTPETTPQKLHPQASGAYDYAPDTPTPARFGRPAEPSPPTTVDKNGTITTAVFTILDSHKCVLSTEAAAELRALLDRHSMRHQGVAKGRDVARQTIQKRDATIVHQAQRIAELETELESVRARGARFRDRTGV